MRNKLILLALLGVILFCGCSNTQFKARGESVINIGVGGR